MAPAAFVPTHENIGDGETGGVWNLQSGWRLHPRCWWLSDLNDRVGQVHARELGEESVELNQLINE